MLLWLADYLAQYYSAFSVFHYLTVRGIMGVLTALFIAMAIGPYMIEQLKTKQIGQSIREDGPQSHLAKEGTPTMGGALILVAILISALLWGDLTNRYIWVTIAVTAVFGAVGWVDDYRKVFRQDTAGLPARWKYFWHNKI